MTHQIDQEESILEGSSLWTGDQSLRKVQSGVIHPEIDEVIFSIFVQTLVKQFTLFLKPPKHLMVFSSAPVLFIEQVVLKLVGPEMAGPLTDVAVVE